MKSFRLGVLGLGMGAMLLCCTACGAATSSPASPSSRSAAGRQPRQVNPAMQAALEVIRLEPVVPFSSSQVQKMVPILQALAKTPNEASADLATQGKAIEALFTATQQEALKNMAAAGPGAAGGPAGGFGGGPGGAGARAGAGRGAGGFRFSRSGSSASGAGAPRFNPAAIYQRAISTLQGGGAPSSSTAGAATGA